MAIFLEFDGIDGGVTDDSFAGQIAIDSCTFGVNRPIEMITGDAQNRSASKPNFDQIHVQKLLDSASIGLFQATIQGKEGNDAVISFTRSVDDETTTYLSITLENCVSSDYDISAHGDQLPNESLALSYTGITYSYTGSTEDGSAGSPASYGFDLVTAKKK